MIILKIAWKEIKQDFRDTKTFLFMLVLPIALMLILGTALNSVFDHNIKIDKMHVLYHNTANKQTTVAFESFTKEMAKSNIHFEATTDPKHGKEQVKQGKLDGYATITQTGITIYVNDTSGLANSFLQGALQSFTDKYHVASAIIKTAPDKANELFSKPLKHDYIKDQALVSGQQMSSMGYYAIVITTMIVLYGAIPASFLITHERTQHTADRLVIAPIRKSHIFMGKLLGSIVVLSLCALIVVVFSSVIYKANWGEHWGLLALLLLTEIIFAISLGLGLSFLTKTPPASRTLVMIIIQISSFFGGAYFRIENPEGFMKFLTNLSPLTWENNAIMKMIYANDLSGIVPTIGLNIGLAFVFLLAATIIFRKREAL